MGDGCAEFTIGLMFTNNQPMPDDGIDLAMSVGVGNVPLTSGPHF
jgi:hypothetical protein